ncbi:MAG: nucleotidyltransferase domain-containing protein [Nanoarchaeota archaeon]|nr:nucleotidyltransferase domain-containing protein [Nanoarchaeota archaeon]
MVGMLELKLTNLQQRILRLFFIQTGKSLNSLAIAKNLKVSQTAVSKSLPFLEKNNFIQVKKDNDSKRLSIQLKEDNLKIQQLKRVDNLKLLYESGFVDFIEKEFAGAVVILFGSYAYGEDVYNSDIDIAIVGRKEKKIKIEKFEKVFEKEIRINFYESFEKIHKNLKSNIFNGIVLLGRINL